MISAISFQAKPIQYNIRKQNSSAIRNTGDQISFTGKKPLDSRDTLEKIMENQTLYDNSGLVAQMYLISEAEDKEKIAQKIAEIITDKGAPKFLGKPKTYGTNYFLAAIVYEGIDPEGLDAIMKHINIIEKRGDKKIEKNYIDRVMTFMYKLKEKVNEKEDEIRDRLKPSTFDSVNDLKTIIDESYLSQYSTTYSRVIAEKLLEIDDSKINEAWENLKKADPDICIVREVLSNLYSKTRGNVETTNIAPKQSQISILAKDMLEDPIFSDPVPGGGSFRGQDIITFLEKIELEEYL